MVQVTAQLVKELRDRTGIGMGKCKEALEEAEGNIELAIENLRKAGMASAVKKEGRETKEGIIKTSQQGDSVSLIEINAETDFVVKNDHFQQFAQNLADEVARTSPANVVDLLQQKYSQDPKLSIDEYRASLVQSLGENIQVKRLEIFTKKSNTSLALYSHGGEKLVTLVEITGSADESALAKEIAMHVAAEAPEYLTQEEIPERVIAHEKEIARAQIKNKPENIIGKILEGKLRAYYDQVCLVHQRFVKNPDITIAELVAKRSKEIGTPLKVSYFMRWTVGE